MSATEEIKEETKEVTTDEASEDAVINATEEEQLIGSREEATEKETFEVDNEDLLLFDDKIKKEENADEPAVKVEAPMETETPKKEPANKKALTYFRPSRNDFRLDEGYLIQQRTVIVGPLDVEATTNPILVEELKKSELMNYKYKRSSEGQLKGFISFQMDTVDGATEAAEKIKPSVGEGVQVSRLTEDFKATTEYNDILSTVVKQETDESTCQGKPVDRTLALSGVLKSVTVEQIKKAIPEAEKVSLHFKDTFGDMGYAYVEFTHKDFAQKMVNEAYELGGNKAKLFALLQVPPLHHLFHKIDRESMDGRVSRGEPLTKKKRLTYGEYVSSLRYYLNKEPNSPQKAKIEEYLKKVRHCLNSDKAHDGGVNSGRGRGGSRGRLGYNLRGRGSPRGNWNSGGITGIMSVPTIAPRAFNNRGGSNLGRSMGGLSGGPSRGGRGGSLDRRGGRGNNRGVSRGGAPRFRGTNYGGGVNQSRETLSLLRGISSILESRGNDMGGGGGNSYQGNNTTSNWGQQSSVGGGGGFSSQIMPSTNFYNDNNFPNNNNQARSNYAEDDFQMDSFGGQGSYASDTNYSAGGAYGGGGYDNASGAGNYGNFNDRKRNFPGGNQGGGFNNNKRKQRRF